MIEASFVGTLVRQHGVGAWFFVTLPLDVADDIRRRVERVGFGSVAVDATIGATSWSTSVFPDTQSGSFVLPVKAAVRKQEDVDDGSEVHVRLRIRTDR
jgi:hypothetical protein